MWDEHVKSKAGKFGIGAGTRKPGIMHKGRNADFLTKRRDKTDQLVGGED